MAKLIDRFALWILEKRRQQEVRDLQIRALSRMNRIK